VSTPQRLYFMRHGLADRDAFAGSDDYLRPLTDEGKRRIEASAELMARMQLGIDLILTSPLTRAEETATIVARHLGLTGALFMEQELGFGFSTAGLDRLLKAFPDAKRLLLVGHEPGFSQVIGKITGGSWVVCKKGSLARVDLRSGDRPGGDLVWLIPPRLLAR